MKKPIEDHCTKGGAEKLAARIQNYWGKNGKPEVRAWAEAITFSVEENAKPQTIYRVASNLHQVSFAPQN